MSETTVINTSSDSPNSSNSNPYDGRVYGLIKDIRDNLEYYGLESGQISIDVDLESSEDSLEIEYRVETLEWYEADGELNLGKEPVSFNNSYSIDAGVRVPEDEVVDVLEDSFDGSAIRANGEIIRESLSPDYDAF